jgi:hypothetical protein
MWGEIAGMTYYSRLSAIKSDGSATNVLGVGDVENVPYLNTNHVISSMYSPSTNLPAGTWYLVAERFVSRPIGANRTFKIFGGNGTPTHIDIPSSTIGGGGSSVSTNGLASILYVDAATTGVFYANGSVPAMGTWNINGQNITNIAVLAGKASGNFDLIQGTADGADTQALRLFGGGAQNIGRGALLSLSGNQQSSTPGWAILGSGAEGAVTSPVAFYTGSSKQVVVSNNAVYFYQPITGPGYLLSNANDFAASAYTNGAVMAWDSTAGKWAPAASTGAATNGLASTNFVDTGYVRTNEVRDVAVSNVLAKGILSVFGGKLGVGLTNPIAPVHLSNQLNPAPLSSTFYNGLESIMASSTNGISFRMISAGADVTAFVLAHARGAIDAPTKLEDEDVVGQFVFQGHDGVTRKSLSTIKAVIEGATGTTDLPTRLSFTTTPDGTSVEVERVRIPSSGGILLMPQSASPSATNGVIYFDSDDKVFYKCTNNATWVSIGTAP